MTRSAGKARHDQFLQPADGTAARPRNSCGRCWTGNRGLVDRADVDQGYRYELLFGLAMSLLDELMRAHGGPAGVRLLNKSLASGAEWTECEQATVEII